MSEQIKPNLPQPELIVIIGSGVTVPQIGQISEDQIDQVNIRYGRLYEFSKSINPETTEIIRTPDQRAGKPIMLIPQEVLEGFTCDVPGEVPKELQHLFKCFNSPHTPPTSIPVQCVYLGDPAGSKMSNVVWTIPGLFYETSIKTFDQIDFTFERYLNLKEVQSDTKQPEVKFDLKAVGNQMLDTFTKAVGSPPAFLREILIYDDHTVFNLVSSMTIKVGPGVDTAANCHYELTFPREVASGKMTIVNSTPERFFISLHPDMFENIRAFEASSPKRSIEINISRTVRVREHGETEEGSSIVLLDTQRTVKTTGELVKFKFRVGQDFNPGEPIDSWKFTAEDVLGDLIYHVRKFVETNQSGATVAKTEEDFYTLLNKGKTPSPNT